MRCVFLHLARTLIGLIARRAPLKCISRRMLVGLNGMDLSSSQMQDQLPVFILHVCY